MTRCDVSVLFPTFDGLTLVIIMFPFRAPKAIWHSHPWMNLQGLRSFRSFGVLVQLWICFYVRSLRRGLDLGSKWPSSGGNVDIAKPNFVILLVKTSSFKLMRAARTLFDLSPSAPSLLYCIHDGCGHVSPFYFARLPFPSPFAMFGSFLCYFLVNGFFPFFFLDLDEESFICHLL